MKNSNVTVWLSLIMRFACTGFALFRMAETMMPGG